MNIDIKCIQNFHIEIFNFWQCFCDYEYVCVDKLYNEKINTTFLQTEKVR